MTCRLGTVSSSSCLGWLKSFLLKAVFHQVGYKPEPDYYNCIDNLESEKEKESHHQAEQSHGLGQGESQDGVGEQLLLEGGVPRVSDDQGSEHGADTSPGAGHTDSGSSSTNELGS